MSVERPSARTLVVAAALLQPQDIFHQTALVLQRHFTLQYESARANLPLTIYCGGSRPVGFILTHEECAVFLLRERVAEARTRVHHLVVIILIDATPMTEWKRARRCEVAAEDDAPDIDSLGWTIVHSQYECIRDIAIEDDWQTFVPVYDAHAAADVVMQFARQFAAEQGHRQADAMTDETVHTPSDQRFRAQLAAFAPLNGREDDMYAETSSMIICSDKA